jgi:outer membrane biosynthesis protein TonB
MRRRPSRLSLRSVLRFGIGGDGFLDRIRALSFAMLGLTAAAALALTLFIANQGWPQVGSLLAVPPVHRTALGENSIVATPALNKAPYNANALAAAVPAARPAGGSAGNGGVGSGSKHSSAATVESPSSNVVVAATPAPESTPSSPGGGSAPKPARSPSVPKPQAPASSTVVSSAPSAPQATATTPTTPSTTTPTTPSTPTGPTSTPASESPSPDEAETPEEGGDSSGHGGSHVLPSESGSFGPSRGSSSSFGGSDSGLPSEDGGGFGHDRSFGHR